MKRGPVLIMAGGTGGHVYPALAVAQALREHSQDVVWLGTQRGIEARIVPAAGIDIEWISIRGLRRKGLAALVVAPFQLGCSRSLSSPADVRAQYLAWAALRAGPVVLPPGCHDGRCWCTSKTPCPA